MVSHPVNMSLRRYVKKERKEGGKEDGRRDYIFAFARKNAAPITDRTPFGPSTLRRSWFVDDYAEEVASML